MAYIVNKVYSLPTFFNITATREANFINFNFLNWEEYQPQCLFDRILERTKIAILSTQLSDLLHTSMVTEK